MTCVHLKRLYALCEKEQLRLGGADLVRIVCTQCGEQEVCPSLLMEEYESQHPDVPDQTPGTVPRGGSPGTSSAES
jgi:hypothetical protein